ncbi:DEAD/DEAH box helicase [Actinomadura sp. 3N508]|uniref:DEAD/DEAH box helicase n=1 Tax=Actinomadura sp. 3N508 TaxID=3375153 RepID=UPI003794976C
MSAAETPDEPGRLAGAMPGKPAFVWVELPREVPPDGLIGREVVLLRLGNVVMVTHHGPDGTDREYPARPRTDDDKVGLLSRVTEDSQVIGFAQELDLGEPPRRWLRLRIHELAGSHDWPPMRVGADEAVLGSARRIAGQEQAGGWAKALAWVNRTLVFPGPPGGDRRRLIALVAPRQDLSQPASCLLRGDGITATLTRIDGEWRLKGLHRGDRDTEKWTQAAVVHVDIELYNATVKARLRGQMREEIARLGDQEKQNSFLVTWQRYHEMENRYALRRLADSGYLEYSGWTHLDDLEDVVRFAVVGGIGELAQRLRDELDAGRETELECATELPEVLGGAARTGEPAGLLDADLARGNQVGVVTHVDVAAGVVDMRMVPRHRGLSDVQADPPHAGFLHIAVSGDRRRLERRHRALDRLLAGRIPLPQLLSLLQDVPARGKERGRRLPAMSEAAGACFKKPPNEMQELALETALNTPDVAVIQGPPGTGKTQLIAALQVRLAEEQRPHAVVSRSMLLTSYQHAAVDNLVERTLVWNLPSVKIDSQNRGSTAHIDRWRRDTIAALKADLAGTAEGRLAQAIRSVARTTTGYCRAPVAAEKLVTLLQDVSRQVSGLVSGELRDRLHHKETELRAAGRVAGLQTDHRRESALRAVRGIRYLPVSFSDDGPQMAEAALQQLERLPAADQAQLDLLRRAADWGEDGPPDEPPDFLPELGGARDELLDRLTGGPGRLVRPAAREDVVDLLNAVIDDLDARRRASREGAEAALLEFLEELEGDPEAVLATLRLYTTSLATTCQQADSRAVQEAKDGERLFDTVIVDEAARANPLDLLIPLTLAAERVILVGDQNQLPHMLEPDVEQELRVGENQALGVLRESLFGRLFSLLHDRDTTPGPRRAVRLNEQYRMHETLGEFVAQNFYGGKLSSPRGAEGFEHELRGYEGRPAAWLSVPHAAGGEYRGQSKARPAEARAIAAELQRHVLAHPGLTFGVISFYSAQVRLIWEQLVRAGLAERAGTGHRPVPALGDRLHVGTVDAFQGKEFDVVYLSVTRSSPVPSFEPADLSGEGPGHERYQRWARRTYGHLLLSNRLCVAMSRQQRLLAVVGDPALFTADVAPAEVRPLAEFHRLCAEPAGPDLRLAPRS